MGEEHFEEIKNMYGGNNPQDDFSNPNRLSNFNDSRMPSMNNATIGAN